MFVGAIPRDCPQICTGQAQGNHAGLPLQFILLSAKNIKPFSTVSLRWNAVLNVPRQNIPKTTSIKIDLLRFNHIKTAYINSNE